jgi:enoyl-[acyl-carrier protein] reductase I
LGGKIDFVLHSIGMVNVRKGNHYTSQNYDYTEKAGMYLRFLSKVMQVLYKRYRMSGEYRCCTILYGSVFSRL